MDVVFSCCEENRAVDAGREGSENVMAKVRLLLADDHAIFRKGLREVIATQSDMTVVGEARDGAEALEKAEELAPDIILMDIEMPRMDGIRASELIRQRNPDIGIIVLTLHREEEYAVEAIRAGARGYLSKELDPAELVEAIRAVNCGQLSIDSALASKALVKLCREAEGSRECTISLTKREQETLIFVVQGATNREIAEALSLSRRTISNRLSGVFKKLGVRNRTQAALYAVEQGLLPST